MINIGCSTGSCFILLCMGMKICIASHFSCCVIDLVSGWAIKSSSEALSISTRYFFQCYAGSTAKKTKARRSFSAPTAAGTKIITTSCTAHQLTRKTHQATVPVDRFCFTGFPHSLFSGGGYLLPLRFLDWLCCVVLVRLSTSIIQAYTTDW